ncbi:MAG: hypothetical protein KAT70_05945, partial [Thermoplasmata archaeon]|nr:hypothetical protein [Thermoplasmata archaeon]
MLSSKRGIVLSLMVILAAVVVLALCSSLACAGSDANNDGLVTNAITEGHQQVPQAMLEHNPNYDTSYFVHYSDGKMVITTYEIEEDEPLSAPEEQGPPPEGSAPEGSQEPLPEEQAMEPSDAEEPVQEGSMAEFEPGDMDILDGIEGRDQIGDQISGTKEVEFVDPSSPIEDAGSEEPVDEQEGEEQIEEPTEDSTAADTMETRSTSEAPSFIEGMELTEISFDEDMRPSIDLTEYFEDDTTSSDQLNYVVSSDNSGLDTSLAMHVLFLRPEPNWHGTASLYIVVGDLEGNLFHANVTIIVNPLNDPPTMEPLDDILFRQGGSFVIADFSDHFNDPEEGLVYEFSSSGEHILPSYDPENGALTISADWTWYGEEVLEITARDGEYTLLTAITVTVEPVWIPVTYS